MPSAEDSTAIPLIDSHCHAWPLWPYEPPVPDDTSRGTVEQLIWEMDQSGVAQACVVAANIERNPDNNEYVARAVAKYPDRLHHFAHIDCSWEPTYHTDGAADRLLDLYQRFRPAGITKYYGSEVDEWTLSQAGLDFFATAERLGLIVSLAVGPEWQPQIGEIARRFPGLPIILHHLAGLRFTKLDADDAFRLTAATAEHSNVYIKVSGFHYGAKHAWDFPQHETIDLVKRLHEVAGGRRLCWGSDYPVGKRDRSFTYQQTIECVRHYCTFLAPEDVPFVLGGTLDLLLRRRKEIS